MKPLPRMTSRVTTSLFRLSSSMQVAISTMSFSGIHLLHQVMVAVSSQIRAQISETSLKLSGTPLKTSSPTLTPTWQLCKDQAGDGSSTTKTPAPWNSGPQRTRACHVTSTKLMCHCLPWTFGSTPITLTTRMRDQSFSLRCGRLSTGRKLLKDSSKPRKNEDTKR